MAKDDDLVSQAAALPFRDRKICLVTTRSGKGLIIPKGHVPGGIHPAQLAAREAWEEAGLIGRITKQPFGEYSFKKAGRKQSVQVFLLAVTDLARAWPEKSFRQRLWYSLDNAIRLVSHDDLRNLLEQFGRTHDGVRASQYRRKSA